MADAVVPYLPDNVAYIATGNLSVGDIIQMPDGRAGIVELATSTGGSTSPRVTGVWTVVKTAGVTILNGDPVYWDHSANAATYRKVNDRDFYLGRAVGDAVSASTTMSVAINVNPRNDIDLLRDPYTTAIVGTQALGGLALNQRGGLNIVLSSTSEAQKVDALSVDGFAVAAKAIVGFSFRVINDGAGTAVDVSIGVANGTDATDAGSITESCFIHLNANDANIYAESDDNSTEVAETDTTINYTEGSSVAERVHVRMDLRDPSDVQIYINGANVLPSTVFDISAASGPLKLLVHVEKTSAADVYELAIDEMWARFTE